MPEAREQFGLEPETYDRLVDWEKRLAVQTPVYRELFAAAGVRRVLDAACGTGRHAALFQSWGLTVEGADVSPAMIAYARTQHGEDERLRWVVRSFTDPVEPPVAGGAAPARGAFDAVICVGNSLALAAEHETVRRALGAMLAALRPGGVLVVQVLNLWRFPEGPVTWQRCTFHPSRVLLQSVHRSGARGYLSFADISLAGDHAEPHYDAAVMLGLTEDELRGAAESSGAAEVQVFGDFQRTAYERATSQDLLLICRRGA